ncbi:probable cytochrome P450 12d1 proximal, mitochondrial [Lucilia cuprina]|uniref:probable cytochrome P450 12d1 proximal, mitochondrial n=1 Tax=Lucilia cuprina TaxID=7375 RepID=UPI001F05BEA0|nr:probable cytochrome P450 12d1 proximal, mitochondrial [Lucilia cuprina]
MFARNLKLQITTTKLKTNIFLLERLLSTQSTFATNFDEALDYKAIPRPSTLRFIRDFMPGGKYENLSFFDFANEMRKHYGDIYVLPGLFGKPDLVMVFNTKDIETVYRNEGQWPQRQGLDSVRHFRENIKGDFFNQTIGLPVSQGEQWGKMRSKVNPVLMKPQNLNMYLKPLQEINDEFISRIKEIRDPNTLEVPGNFDNELNRLAFESISLVALNRRLGLISRARNNPDAERLIECTRLNFDYAFKLDVQPSMWKVIRTPTYYKSMKVQEDLFWITLKYVNETLKQIEEKQKNGDDNQEVYSVLEKLLVRDEKLAVIMAMDMLIAGVDTTSVTLISILLCLAKNPDKQQKLREEILKVMPTKDTVLNESNTKNLPYLRAVIKESMRYFPNGTGSSRKPVNDVILSGYRIPKGSNVVLNFNCLLKDEAFFPQPDKFLPERWLRDENNKKDKLDPFSYLPFGVGPRICVGKRLAELEMEVVLLKLLRNFDVEFNYDASKPFKAFFINVPGIPMRFTFKDIKQ